MLTMHCDRFGFAEERVKCLFRGACFGGPRKTGGAIVSCFALMDAGHGDRLIRFSSDGPEGFVEMDFLTVSELAALLCGSIFGGPSDETPVAGSC